MRFAVVTGVSKGLGESAAKLLLESGVHVIGISRRSNNSLNDYAKTNNVTYQHYACDLGDIDRTEQTANEISESVFSQDPETVYLINNAAVLEPVDQSMNLPSDDLAYHIQVNTIAPMVMMNVFLKQAAETDVQFIGTTITSGAAERPVYGWSAYCTSKASMNMFTTTAALEQQELGTESKVIAFSPGVMDTDMQEKIRSSDADAFKDVDDFREYKWKNLLKDTDVVGGVLVDILTDEAAITNGKIYYVKDYL
ncbi:(S)-benzoin forming benzil reductase [Lentibacillus halophilus]|uniref:(S)-benzoin forming benzil reductase n=1 Tax=Lentibacillus halophilus TaxID=295065 RepID=A0ABN0Z9P4_9BACI